jgi:hypothetical protein
MHVIWQTSLGFHCISLESLVFPELCSVLSVQHDNESYDAHGGYYLDCSSLPVGDCQTCSGFSRSRAVLASDIQIKSMSSPLICPGDEIGSVVWLSPYAIWQKLDIAS